MTTEYKKLTRGVSRALVVGESGKQPQEMFGPRLTNSYKCVETLENFVKLLENFIKLLEKSVNFSKIL